jgi:hypothetical protein
VKSGTIFDNILITDDEKYAEEYGEETWGQTKVGVKVQLHKLFLHDFSIVQN